MSSAATQTPPAATPEQDRLLNAMAWLELHRSTLVTGVIGLLVVFAGVYFWRQAAADKELKANGALLELHARPGDTDSQPSAGDYLKVAEQFPGTPSGHRARLLAAGAFFNESRYAEAQSEFERVLAGGAGDVLEAQAAYGVAASIEASGKTDPAVAKYQEVIRRYAKESVADQARLALARIEESRGKGAAALQLLDEVIRADSGGPFVDQAQNRRRVLLRTHPDLAGTNASAVVVAP